MHVFDVRTEQAEMITEIRFADTHSDYFAADVLRFMEWERNVIEICAEGEESTLKVTSKEHAQNLIKALEKAIELGWLK